MITAEDVQHVARLARLSLTDAESERFTVQLGRIMDYFDELSQVDTDGVEPMSHPIPVVNVMRDDVVIKSLSREVLMENAPLKEGAFFKVPRIGE